MIDSSLTIDSLLFGQVSGLWSPATLLAELLYPELSPGNNSKPEPFLTTSSRMPLFLSTEVACLQIRI